MPSGFCGEDQTIARQVQVWVYVLVGIAILAGELPFVLLCLRLYISL